MPQWTFECPKCGHRWELIGKISDYDHISKNCPECKKGKGEQVFDGKGPDWSWKH
jgi:putative FmdB family regulatory protein